MSYVLPPLDLTLLESGPPTRPDPPRIADLRHELESAYAENEALRARLAIYEKPESTWDWFPTALDPQPGDTVYATVGGRMVARNVISRKGNDIIYINLLSTGLREKICWITSWQDWCQKHRATKERP